jgi:protein-disulfide isomerase
MENETSTQSNGTDENIKQSRGFLDQYKDFLTPLAILVAGSMVSLAILAGGGFTISANNFPAAAGTQAAEPQVVPPSAAAPVVTDEDYIRGNPDAPITIVEYSDFECPFCGRFHPTAQQAMAEYGDQIRWVYRHFPLTQIHPEATPSAEASECVGEQKGADGFWQFADAMFENQQHGLSSALYRQAAQQIGVNIEQYDNCVASRKYQKKVESIQAGGAALGITGTPGSFVNGTPVRGAVPYANLKAIIDAEIEKL